MKIPFETFKSEPGTEQNLTEENIFKKPIL